MRIEPLSINDACWIHWDRHQDERGFFQRVLCADSFEELGLASDFRQSSISFSRDRGTLRGMHIQQQPWTETKILVCLSGRIQDAMVDVRPDSSTFGQSLVVELSPDQSKSLYIPKGIAHGFLTLEDNTLINYTMDQVYAPDAAMGFRFDDPAVSIPWVQAPAVLSDQDRQWPEFETFCQQLSYRSD